MKKFCCLLLGGLLLCGCSAQETFEQVYDELLLPVVAPMGELKLTLPEEAGVPTLVSETGDRLYFCDGYTLAVQTLEAGDLDQTLQSLCGYGRQDLTVLETREGTLDRYDWVFTCIGEEGTQLGRGAILDDGNYHYCATVMAQEAASGSLTGQWDAIFRSMHLEG